MNDAMHQPVMDSVQSKSLNIRLRAKRQGELTKVTALMLHPMHTGMRRSADGSVIPAHFIRRFEIFCEDRRVLQGQLSISVSEDPLLRFGFRGGVPGEMISLDWTDNFGETRSASTQIT